MPLLPQRVYQMDESWLLKKIEGEIAYDNYVIVISDREPTIANIFVN